MSVQLSDGNDPESIETGLLVLAEGGRSGLCDKLGIHRDTREYGQEAVIANVAFSRPHNNTAYERFTPNGPLALLPLPDLGGEHRAALVWTRKSDEVEEVLALSDEDFTGALQQEFGHRLGEFTKVGRRFSYPLSLVEAGEQIRPSLVLIGNVAHSLHPVAGQGFNLAFRDTVRLAQKIITAVREGADPGSMAVLEDYLAVTRGDQDKTTAFTHYMTRLFSSESSAAIWVRKFGLCSIDLIPPLKKAFSSRAMGLGDRQVALEENGFH